MLCTFELNIILQNRTTFVKSLQGRTRRRTESAPVALALHVVYGLLNCGFASPSLCCLYILSKSYEHLACAYLCILLKIHTLLNLTFFFMSQSAKICYLLTFLFGWPWVVVLWHFIVVSGKKREGRDWKSLSQFKIAILFSFKGLKMFPWLLQCQRC